MERTPFMQLAMTITYPEVALEATATNFDGAWERCIARFLKRKSDQGHSEAEVIVQACGGDYLKAAYIITSSTPESCVQDS